MRCCRTSRISGNTGALQDSKILLPFKRPTHHVEHLSTNLHVKEFPQCLPVQDLGPVLAAGVPANKLSLQDALGILEYEFHGLLHGIVRWDQVAGLVLRQFLQSHVRRRAGQGVDPVRIRLFGLQDGDGAIDDVHKRSSPITRLRMVPS